MFKMKIDPLYYTEERLQNILTNLPKREQRIVALAYATGARVSELIQITKEDISIEEGYMNISCKVLKKRKKDEQNQRRLAIVRLDETWVITPINELLAESLPGKPLINYNRVTLYRWLKGKTGINPHGFRAIRATHLAKKGFTAHQLKHFFGWSSVSPSDYYVRLNVKDLRY
jgi:integrase/recombinase XerD